MQVHSDAASGTGFGIFWEGKWCAEKWPSAWSEQDLIRDLTFLEFFPILVAVVLQTHHF